MCVLFILSPEINDNLLPLPDGQGSGGVSLIPRVHRVVDGLDLGLYKEALSVRREWESKNVPAASRS